MALPEGQLALKLYLTAHSYSYSPWTTSPKEKDVGFQNTLKPRLSGFYGSRQFQILGQFHDKPNFIGFLGT